MNTSRNYTVIDKLILHCDLAVTTLLAKPKHHARENPAKTISSPPLTDEESKHAAGLMRINHAGEVCAQALYQGQAITARSEAVTQAMRHSAYEEFDHLAWCNQRLYELDSHASLLNIFWYLGALSIGITAGIFGDKWSLGFLSETEEQVVKHLETHLEKLPENDHKSRAIVTQMRDDEAQHRDKADELGAAKLPEPIRTLMQWSSKIMTRLAYYI
ncbi:MAG: 2-polyprenyl-3-methyl-6-methoxy-1,4-benzoquinone monooxygenase [Gammaproteobacteria bacterium]